MKPSWTEVVSFATLLVFALVMAHGWPWAFGASADVPKITDWLTALGTVGAVVAALFVMLVDTRKRASERKKARNIYKWLFMAEVMIAQAQVEELGELLDEYTAHMPGQALTDETKAHAARVIDKLHVPTLEKHIETLVHFDDSTAQALASLSANLPGLQINARSVFEPSFIEAKRQALAYVMRDRVALVLQACARIDWGVDE